MKCPHCSEELGINDVCINPMCSYFGNTIKNTEKTNIDYTEENLNSRVNADIKVDHVENNSKSNDSFNQNKVYHNRNDYDNNQNTNRF